jgi:hypothetical protein
MKHRYLVEMKAYGRVSVLYIDAENQAQAWTKAKQKHGVEVRITRQIDTSHGGMCVDDFDLLDKLK